MNIVCPQCGFSRRLPEERLPAGAVIATCPRCACRFRFSSKNGVLEVLPARAASSGDNPVPPDGEQVEDLRETARRAYVREAERFSREQAVEDTAPRARRNAPGRGPDADGNDRADGPMPDRQDGGQHSGCGTDEAPSGTDAGSGAAAPDERNPWDAAPAGGGWLAAFYQTVLGVMFAAPRFFSTLRPGAQQMRPLAFYLTICVFQTVVERFWGGMFLSALAPSAAADPELEKLLALLAPRDDLALSLLLRCGFLVLQLYVFSFLMFLAYRIVARERAQFALIFQIMAYSSAPALLCVVPALGSLAGMVWGVACLAVGCRVALRLTWAQTLFGFLPLVFVFGPMLLQAMALMQG